MTVRFHCIVIRVRSRAPPVAEEARRKNNEQGRARGARAPQGTTIANCGGIGAERRQWRRHGVIDSGRDPTACIMGV